MRRIPAFDMPLLFCFLLLVGFGIAFIFTASYPQAISDSGTSNFLFAGRQIIFACLGIVALFSVLSVPMPLLRRFATAIFIVTVGLLFAVLVYGAAKHGNKAWIEIGSIQFQPSEFAKVAIVIALAAYLAKRPGATKSPRGLLVPGFILLFPLGLIGLQGDLGTASVVALGGLIFLAIAGVKFRYWGLTLLLFGVLAVGVTSLRHPERISAWRNPYDVANQAAFQPRNSIIAIGSGGVLGRGFCQSRQKWGFVPGAHNDYILAIIAEELGFLLTLLFVFAPYLFLIGRGFTIAHRAPDEFSALLASGCTVMLGAQAFINMCVVANIIPCMGITLPFISYGGTSLLASMMMAGLLLNVSGHRVHKDAQVEKSKVTKLPVTV